MKSKRVPTSYVQKERDFCKESEPRTSVAPSTPVTPMTASVHELRTRNSSAEMSTANNHFRQLRWSDVKAASTNLGEARRAER